MGWVLRCRFPDDEEVLTESFTSDFFNREADSSSLCPRCYLALQVAIVIKKYITFWYHSVQSTVEDRYYLCETYPIFSPFSDLVIPSGQGQGHSEAPVALSSTCLEQKVFQLAETTYAGITKRKCIVSPCLGAGLCGQKPGLPLVGHSWFQWPCYRAQLSPAPTWQHLRDCSTADTGWGGGFKQGRNNRGIPGPKGRRTGGLQAHSRNPLKPTWSGSPPAAQAVGITGIISVKSLI